ncbi:ECF RNA polymerase sigma factor SigD [Aquisphaera giovannonii]|uniref:ECF RNA polymerase sigma factor SigD n=1 Tax=Aquisphaera giovannonii TaxID=406548 RepID=A0A5B9W949_9BACT|nr:sigma-70 family RNA polymerase sigma factor [Aquisphaera giovannonii]QEH36400.1 ECF RNA polymerase sigma factor SigD [Aquisphaera giovannonii]
MSTSDSDDIERWLALAASGDTAAWQEVVGRYRERLRRMVAVRLNPRLLGRFDPSDILQETFLDASVRLQGYLASPKLPFFLWLRYLAAHHLGRIHRDHLGRQKRAASLEVSLDRPDWQAVSSEALAGQLLDAGSRASEHAIRAERKRRLLEALEAMEPLDREILSLRHFEQLTRAESARTLGITEAAAAKRYLRALERLRESLSGLPGGLEGL